MVCFTSRVKPFKKRKNVKLRCSRGEFAPILTNQLSARDDLTIVKTSLSSDDEAGIKAFVKTEKVDFVLVVPSTFSNDVLSSGQQTIMLYLNDAGLNMVQRRVNEVVKEIENTNQQSAFISLGVSEAIQEGLLNPIVIEKVSIADKREDLGEKIGGFIPYLVFILCLQGAMLPATDIGAGEKERGTLETLLITPIPRQDLVMGKFFTIAFAEANSAMVTIGSMFVWGVLLAQGMAIKLITEFMGAISPIDFVLMFLMLVPVVAIFASLC